ncbi:MAG: ribosome biogenesis GTP-binding protein YihA/YsxC [gamma proteobacterium symbiont of Bathyaustriella thionipta]|nr:ribosome biogenesis GTP-binding protein YihA/YsxC [gamma proteobacterium symbiont of Bathyaustriella thionipta]MCU7949029.1 ribosome biogenesis GTP-binding protein YihA/YsxC [gamma proteobacterium symbiont of Bathyaustriella thionipta]MCU7954516.1 ribosome biogenesis GTP-binding protein YihA/YsxC [gamma proteobacterium symbiont of Bathyaustriella thionipta]MCU7955613.1 ribosome biogenesis GTP-binding protein YihA/YsxC [gamma proteobacterium symbiont of Bathyaustriella thionipta]MCU7968611.1 
MSHNTSAKPNHYRSAEFLLSVNNWSQLPQDDAIEVAFAGRSNAGKSSAINTISDIKSLCRTSKTPGRTQMINYFSIDPERHLVDLPGYGYAKVPIKVKQHWQVLLERYLIERSSLRGVMMIMDVRRPLTEYDCLMLQWCQKADMSAHILLTKADKFKRGAAQNILLKVRRTLNTEYPGTSVQLFSALHKTGVDEAREVLDNWFALESKQAE